MSGGMYEAFAPPRDEDKRPAPKPAARPCRHPAGSLERLGEDPNTGLWYVWCTCGSWKLGARGRWRRPSGVKR
jgi:hypothetical protein